MESLGRHPEQVSSHIVGSLSIAKATYSVGTSFIALDSRL